MQFKIPQNVDIEDKIIAFITFRQLFILLGGGGVAYAIYTVSVGRMPVFAYTIPIVFILVLTVLIAFLKVDNMSFIKMVLQILEGIINPSLRIWSHPPDFPTPFERISAELSIARPEPTGRTKEHDPAKSIESLASITNLVDQLDKDSAANDPSSPPL